MVQDTHDLESNQVLRVDGLRTYFHTHEGVVKAVDGASFGVKKGKVLGVVGESGCGKSITAQSILRIVPPPGQIVDGSILFRQRLDKGGSSAIDEEVDLTALDPRGREIRHIRGAEISMVFQEPMTSLDPLYTIGSQLLEAITLHQDVTKAEARAKAIEMLHRVGMPRPSKTVDSYAHQLSGGMRQRAMIAIALSCNPTLLIADEPTTALDVTTEAQILELMKRLQQETGMSIMYITHDLGVVAEICDEVIVMYLGKVVERASVDAIYHDALHPYTQALLKSIPWIGRRAGQRLEAIEGIVPDPYAVPSGCPFWPRCSSFLPGVCDRDEPEDVCLGLGHSVRCHLYGETATVSRPALKPAEPEEADATGAAVSTGAGATACGDLTRAPLTRASGSEDIVLEVEGLQKHFPIQRGFLRRTVGQVKAVDGVSFHVRRGETVGLVGESGCGKTTVGRCLLRLIEPTGGQVVFNDEDTGPMHIRDLDAEQMRKLRRNMQIVFQDPYSSLSPRLTLKQIVGEPLVVNGVARGKELDDRVAELLQAVGMRPEYMDRYPHAFSGGQRQRISLARALALNPKFIVADEPVSALDVSVQAQVLNLMKDLQEQFALTYLFISHNLSVIEHICDRVVVMYVGKVVESAETEEPYRNPRHPYTEALMSAVPKPDPRARSERIVLPGEVADPANPPEGCYFHPRCRYVQAICRAKQPLLREIGEGHFVSCHHAEDLHLRGVT